MLKKILKLKRRQKQIIAASVDYALLTFAFWSALALRFETFSPASTEYAWQILLAPLLAIPIFIQLGLYRAVTRFMEDRAVFVIVSGLSASVLLLAAIVAMSRSVGFSRGVLLIYWLLAIVYIGSSRFVARRVFLNSERAEDSRQRVAIYGAGRSGMQLAYALRAGREYLPVAFFDDNPIIQHSELGGLRVYSPVQIGDILREKNISEVLLASPSASRARRVDIVHQLEGFGCAIKIVPRLSALVNANVSALNIRQLEIEDLLGRDAVLPDSDLLSRCITAKSVLVSGAGGSIGSELCRQIICLKPTRLVLIEMSEFSLYAIEQELRNFSERNNLGTEIIPVLGSVLQQERNQKIMRTFAIQTVYHAAAYKHVPLVEHNPLEGLFNNVIGTQHLAEAARDAGVETFVLISTDKAVRPTNVMGASKRLAELVLQALARTQKNNDEHLENPHRTRFCMVRFGNVLGSSGSVVPLFKKQIAAGGPITLTHPDITRYFMTIPEAAQLVIQAGAMAEGGEVYVLDMGEPIKIIDLAKRMIHLSGKRVREAQTPNGNIAIEIVGLRPGEKLFEELLIGENVEKTEHPLIMRAYEHEIVWNFLQNRLSLLNTHCQRLDYQQALSLLSELVSEYAPNPHENGHLLWESLITPE